MGRKSLAELIYSDLQTKEDSEKCTDVGQWLVLYDFPGVKPNSRFWKNLHRLKSLTGVGGLVQYSAFITSDKNAAHTMVKLVYHYDGEVCCYKIAMEIDVNSLI